MDVNNVALFSNVLGAFLFLVLSSLLLINWRGQLAGGLLIVASLLSTFWFSAIAYNSLGGVIPLSGIRVLETLRDAAWLSFLYFILRQGGEASLSGRFKVLVPVAITGLVVSTLLVTLLYTSLNEFHFPGIGVVSVNYIAYLLAALLGLLLVEKVYRSTLPDARWAMKFLCLGVGGIFAYDFFLYSEAILFNRVNPDIWFVRGAINATCVPLIIIAIARNPEWKMDLFVSRHVVYQSMATTIAGIYLVFMSIAGYYIKNYSGTWGSALQTLFLFAAIMLLLMIAFSADARTKLKSYIAEHFYKNKYDYRQEWLGVTRLLSEKNEDGNIYRTIVESIADIMKCPGGAIWLTEDGKNYRNVESVRFYDPIDETIILNSDFIELVTGKHAVLNIDYYKDESIVYGNIELPGEFTRGEDTWLFMALINADTLIGFVLLSRPKIATTFTFEDVDILETIGFQLASHIALLNATERLTEARQFEAFNRLSAFVVHDIKNMVAQLSLINNNARKFKHDPEFINDVFATIENSVAKMKRLLSNLQKGELIGNQASQKVSLEGLVNEVIKVRGADLPKPVLLPMESDISIQVEKDKLVTVLEHLVQNAQEATPDDGQVEIKLERLATQICVQVKDTGTGMDADFIRNKLFKPFYTTKGNAGMGIGVYESREIISAMGGHIDVDSEPGGGSAITIRLPWSEDPSSSVVTTG